MFVHIFFKISYIFVTVVRQTHDYEQSACAVSLTLGETNKQMITQLSMICTQALKHEVRDCK